MEDFSKIRVSVINPEDEVRERISSLIGLSEEFRVVGTYSDRDMLLNEIGVKQPEIVVLDVADKNRKRRG